MMAQLRSILVLRYLKILRFSSKMAKLKITATINRLAKMLVKH